MTSNLYDLILLLEIAGNDEKMPKQKCLLPQEQINEIKLEIMHIKEDSNHHYGERLAYDYQRISWNYSVLCEFQNAKQYHDKAIKETLDSWQTRERATKSSSMSASPFFR